MKIEEFDQIVTNVKSVENLVPNVYSSGAGLVKRRVFKKGDVTLIVEDDIIRIHKNGIIFERKENQIITKK